MSRDDRRDTHQRNEHFEPYEESAPVPLPVLWVALALALWGAVVLFNSFESEDEGKVERAERVIPEATAARAVAEGNGAGLFQASCATCHQPNASGVRNAIPPLADSPFVAARPEVMVQILLHGIDGPIRVGTQDYDGHMPDFSSVLDDAEIASIVQYVRGTWAPDPGATAPAIDAAFVAAERARFPDRGAWQGGAELARVVDPSLPAQPAVSVVEAAGTDPVVRQLVDEGRGAAWSCASCHGERGQGTLNVPRLAGLPADYIVKQLKNYLDGSRRNENMEVVARTLAPAEMQALGEFYAAIRAPSNAYARLGGDLARGEELALRGDWSKDIPSCFSCHGPSGVGVAPEFPALAAQHPEYTVAQLAGWVAGRRDNSDIQLMDHIARALDDGDRRAVADYLATLPPVPAAPASTVAAAPLAAEAGQGNAPAVNLSSVEPNSPAGERHVQD
ncbi:c-type cytochrome [Stenotrophomonas sp. NPDC077421]|uniref:C-type cytochrome n=1 Tax=Stenotrophomonas maltophilia TaxID=40324 RepID=A0AAI9C1S1_STEMA|nr:c-type cytochrome [Stenotrophomonas maltophilia]